MTELVFVIGDLMSTTKSPNEMKDESMHPLQNETRIVGMLGVLI